jgi:hypothetical protein
MIVNKTSSRVAISVLFLSVFVIYVVSPVVTSSDSQWTLYVAGSLVREGNIDLNEYDQFISSHDYRVFQQNHNTYYFFPIGTPIIIAPAVKILDILFPLKYSVDFTTYLQNNPPNHFTNWIEKWLASLIAILAGIAFYIFIQQQSNDRIAFFLTFIFLLSTAMYSTSSRALWQHGPTVLLLSLTFIQLRPDQPNKTLRLSTAGFLLAFSFIVRPTNAITLLFIGLYVIWNYRTLSWPYFLTQAAVFLVFFLVNLQEFGFILPPYYLPQRLQGNSTFWQALAGNLISPSRGFLIYSPVFIFSLFGIFLLIREKKLQLTQLPPYFILILLAHWITVSSFRPWYGGWTIGYRFFADMTPILTYLLMPVVQFAMDKKNILLKTLLVITTILGVLIHTWCSISPAPMKWNKTPVIISKSQERLWDWQDPQFLRGLPITLPANSFDPNGND